MATTSFWQILDELLEHSKLAVGDTVNKTGDELAAAMMANKEFNTGELTAFDVERELRGAFAQYSNWAIMDLGDHWSFIKR